jgi:hypothetical protein
MSSPLAVEAGKIKTTNAAGYGGWNLENVGFTLDGDTSTFNPTNGVYQFSADSDMSYFATVDDGDSNQMGFVFAKNWPVGEPPGIKVIHDDLNVKKGKPVNAIMSTSYLDGHYLDSDDPIQVIASSPYQTHKRYKVAMLPATVDGEGAESVDLVFNVEAEEGSRGYEVYQKINNWTDKRLAGFTLEVGFGIGEDFQQVSPELLDDLHLSVPSDFWSAGQLATFSSGLFSPGDEHTGLPGFFDAEQRAGFLIDEYDAQEISGSLHATQTMGSKYANVPVGNTNNQFGPWLPNSMLPYGIFYDDDGNPSTDAALVAWYGHNASDELGWMRGSEHDYADVSDEEIEAMGNDLSYSVGLIDDLVNIGLKYIVTVGDISSFPEPTFTIRVTPMLDTSGTEDPGYVGETPNPPVTFDDTVAEVLLQPEQTFVAGSLLTARVGDADLNIDTNALEEVTVTVSTDTGLEDDIILLELGTDRGAFAGVLPEAYSSVPVGTVVTLSYYDADSMLVRTSSTVAIAPEYDPEKYEELIATGIGFAPPGVARSEAELKMTSQLASLFNEDLLAPGQSAEDVKMEMLRLNQWQTGTPELLHVSVRVVDGNNVDALLTFFSDTPKIVPEWNLLIGWVDKDVLVTPSGLALQTEVVFIEAVDPPRFRTGSVTTAGDTLHNGPTTRSSFGIDGSPIHVGVISDGVSNAATAQSTDDLPSDLNVLSIGAGDEGTAMLEIIHDIAPGAKLSFHAAGSSKASFQEAITALHNAGCNVICDDVGWYTDPFFEQSPLGSHIQSLQSLRDYVHVSAAGNDGLRHYQNTFTNIQPDTFHDHPLVAHVAAGESLDIFMQWDESLLVTPADDYDMFLFLATDTGYTTPLGTGGMNRGVVGETIYYTNYGTEGVDVLLWIKRHSGTQNRTLEIMLNTSNPNSYPYSNNISAADSIFGHPGHSAVIAVASTGVAAPDVVKPDCSLGPFTIIGSFAAPLKPDVSAADGVAVTGAGDFGSPFNGTSASASHVAGLCALAWSDSPSLTATTLRSALPIGACLDLPVTAPDGPDTTFGHGRVMADLWTGLLNSPPSIMTPSLQINCNEQSPTRIPNLIIMDSDADEELVQLISLAPNGIVFIDETIPGGILPGHTIDNGTPHATVTSTLSRINVTLAAGGLSYQANPGFTPPGEPAPDIIYLLFNDLGSTGLGGPLNDLGTVTLQTHQYAYHAWQFGSFTPAELADPLVSGDSQDPDNDCYTNHWEFFMGTDPMLANLPGEFTQTSSPPNLIYQFRVDNAILPLSYKVRDSQNLQNWLDVPTGMIDIQPHPLAPTAKKVIVTYPMTTHPSSFLRVEFDPYQE